MRHILFLLFMAFTLQAIAQYPATGNKMRLGWQTTGDGLVYRGAIGDTATLDPSGINNAWMLLDTANGNLYAYRAKAWRLVSGGGGGGVTMPFDSVTFNVNETDASLRELKYSEEKGYLQYGGQDSVQIPLLPGIWYVRNDTSVTIPKGTVLRATGTLGASGRIKVKHMIANGSIDAMYILGIAMQDIAVGADGYAMSQGKIRKINTQAYSEGAVLYADVDTLGGLTQTEPTGSNLKLPIAFVVNSASNGTIAVRVTSGAYMRDLHDTYITSPDSSASLYYNKSEGIWRDTGAAVLVADTTAMLSPYLKKQDTLSLSNRINTKLNISDTSVFARDFQISGTTNRLAMFTGGNTVGNSNAFQDANGNIGVGATPSGTAQILDLYRASASLYPLLRGNSTAQDYAWTFSDGTNTAYAGMMGGTVTGSIGTGGYSIYLPSGSGSPITFSTNATERMRITSAGIIAMLNSNVGIGTASPLSAPAGTGLTLGTTSSGRSLYMVSSSDGNNGLIQFKDPAGADALQIAGTSTSNWLYGYGSRPLRFFTNATEVMRIEAPLTGLGNVGIHTSSPSRPLHVNANSSMIIPSGATGTRPASGADGDLRYSTTFSNIEFYRTNRWMRPLVGTVANNKVAFASGDTLTSNTNFHFDNTNTRLGIGTASPTTTLHVAGRATVDLGGANLFINGGNSTVTGSDNIALGGSSLISITTGVQNVSIGGQVLRNTTTGTANFGIGTSALRDNISGSSNVAFGTNALLKNTTGNGNLAIGTDAMRENNVDNNVGIGFGALSQNISGTSNTALGYASLLNVTTSQNTAIGSEVLKSVTTGNQNTAIGSSALFFLTTGNNNVSIGRVSGTALTSGSNNVLIGETAAYFAGSGFGSPTTSINNSIIIGQDSRPSAATMNTNEIVIGTSAIGNGSNTTTIGNSSTTATILPAGRLGIAITSPTARLHLPAGTASANTAPLKFTSGTNLTTPEAGAVEWNGTNVFVTNSSATRQTVNQGLTGSATIDFASTNAQNSRDAAITITGASDGDAVSLGVPNAAVNANTCYTAWVSAANTVTVRFNNYSSGAVDPASATFKVFVTKF